MSAEEEKERLLTHSEVMKILEDSMEKPDKIYHGPEEDQVSYKQFGGDDIEEGEPEEVDPAARLSFEKRATMDHVGNFVRIKKDKAEKMIKELVKIERVTHVHAYKIAELMPKDETELRPVFAKDRFTLEPEELKKILETIDGFRE